MRNERDRAAEADFDDVLLNAQANEFLEVLDFDSWTETSGFGSIEAIICPHCRAPFDCAGELADGIHRCAQCEELMVVRRMDSPLGQAWLTLAVPPATEAT